jgi:hypothetical protein
MNSHLHFGSLVAATLGVLSDIWMFDPFIWKQIVWLRPNLCQLLTEKEISFW